MSNKKHKFHKKKYYKEEGIMTKIFFNIFQFLIGIVIFLTELIMGIFGLIIGSIWGLVEVIFGIVVLIFVISLFIPTFGFGGLFGLAIIGEGIDYSQGLYYDTKEFLFSFQGTEITEECKNRILLLTPKTLNYQNYFLNSGFEFKWLDGVKTKFKEGFELNKGQNEGENIRYYYPNREFTYSKKVVDSTGIILGEDNFRAKLLFEQINQKMIFGMGTIEFKVVNITPTYCNFYNS